jgi:hypothetical protein
MTSAHLRPATDALPTVAVLVSAHVGRGASSQVGNRGNFSLAGHDLAPAEVQLLPERHLGAAWMRALSLRFCLACALVSLPHRVLRRAPERPGALTARTSWSLSALPRDRSKGCARGPTGAYSLGVAPILGRAVLSL